MLSNVQRAGRTPLLHLLQKTIVIHDGIVQGMYLADLFHDGGHTIKRATRELPTRTTTAFATDGPGVIIHEDAFQLVPTPEGTFLVNGLYPDASQLWHNDYALAQAEQNVTTTFKKQRKTLGRLLCRMINEETAQHFSLDQNAHKLATQVSIELSVDGELLDTKFEIVRARVAKFMSKEFGMYLFTFFSLQYKHSVAE